MQLYILMCEASHLQEVPQLRICWAVLDLGPAQPARRPCAVWNTVGEDFPDFTCQEYAVRRHVLGTSCGGTRLHASLASSKSRRSCVERETTRTLLAYPGGQRLHAPFGRTHMMISSPRRACGGCQHAKSTALASVPTSAHRQKPVWGLCQPCHGRPQAEAHT